MIFLRVLSKIFLWPHYSGPQELGGPGSLNRLNPRFLRHWVSSTHSERLRPTADPVWSIKLCRVTRSDRC